MGSGFQPIVQISTVSPLTIMFGDIRDDVEGKYHLFDGKAFIIRATKSQLLLIDSFKMFFSSGFLKIY